MFVKAPQDARSSLVKLTHRSEPLHDKVLEIALEREKLLLSGITQEELDVLINVLLKLNNNVKTVNAYEPKFEHK